MEMEQLIILLIITLIILPYPLWLIGILGVKKNWYLNFGPYVGFLVNAKESRFDFDVKNAFETTDVGLAYGIGVKIPVSEYLKIFIEFDGQGGFTNIFKDPYFDNTTNSRGALNVGLNFML